MYRKSMREALREAREYRDPVKEDRGFSSQQIKMAYGVLNDPRYKGGNYSGAFKAIEKIARGLASHPDVANALKRANEELEEANMKRILGALQDKLSKEGGAAGFDDLKKTAKSMGLDLTPAMLKDMPGIKQHRDGDYILEAFTKKDFKDNERDNEHGLNAKKVVDMFGTGAEKMKIDAINARHNMRRSISREDQRARDEIVNKY